MGFRVIWPLLLGNSCASQEDRRQHARQRIGRGGSPMSSESLLPCITIQSTWHKVTTATNKSQADDESRLTVSQIMAVFREYL